MPLTLVPAGPSAGSCPPGLPNPDSDQQPGLWESISVWDLPLHTDSGRLFVTCCGDSLPQTPWQACSCRTLSSLQPGPSGGNTKCAELGWFSDLRNQSCPMPRIAKGAQDRIGSVGDLCLPCCLKLVKVWWKLKPLAPTSDSGEGEEVGLNHGSFWGCALQCISECSLDFRMAKSKQESVQTSLSCLWHTDHNLEGVYRYGLWEKVKSMDTAHKDRMVTEKAPEFWNLERWENTPCCRNGSAPASPTAPDQWQVGTCFLPRKPVGFRQKCRCIYFPWI